MERVLENVINCLEKIVKKNNTYQAFVGFDGFVDTLVRPVKNVEEESNMVFFDSIEEFGTYLSSKAGKSCSIEMCKMTEKMGGNAAIYSSALSRLGLFTKCVGAFGYPEIKNIFDTDNEHMNLITISDPGLCTALEFNDGKIMLSQNDGINEINYQLLMDRLGHDRLYNMIYKSDIISLMNWSEVPGSTDIWKGLLSDIFETLPRSSRKKLFIDISDCSRRSCEAIKEMLELIVAFTDYCDVALSLNENEFEILCDVCDISTSSGIETAGRCLRELCPVKYLIIHLTHGAYAVFDNGSCFAKNRHVKKPLISTGGGDNFNAGLSYGLMTGVDIQEALILANAVSGFYVTYGYSAGLKDIIEYLYEWRQDIEYDAAVRCVSENREKVAGKEVS